MQWIEKQGKTIDEAISLALEELDTTIEKVDIEVIEEPSKGFLGLIGGKLARVQVALKPDPVAILRDFLEGVCGRMLARLDIEIEADGDTVSVELEGSDLGLVIGKHGQTLDALQYLANVVFNRSGEERKRVTIDAGGYRKRREQTLLQLANRLAERAKRINRKVMLEPMNAYERRIIHMALQDDRQVVTYSEGAEPYRKVVIDLR